MMVVADTPAEERKAEIETVPFWWPDNRTFLSFSFVGMFFFTLSMLLLRPMPITDSAGTLLTALVAVITTKLVTIVDFEFGSSKQGQKTQDANTKSSAAAITTLAAAAAGPVVPAAAAPEEYRGYTLTVGADKSVATAKGGVTTATYSSVEDARAAIDRLVG